jgi:hypothetical protein
MENGHVSETPSVAAREVQEAESAEIKAWGEYLDTRKTTK